MKMKANLTIATTSALALMMCAPSSMAAVIDTTVFGSDNDGLGGFTHTAIDGTNTFLSTLAGSVQYRNQNTGSIDAGFIKQQTGIDRTADTGLKYTVTGTFTLSDGYADDNNRIDLVLFTDLTTVLSRDNLGQIGIVWNTDDNSRTGGPTGNNAQDNLKILDGFNSIDADAGVPPVLRDQTIPFAQDLYQGSQITVSASFWFTGPNINIEASMTDPGGLTQIGTATVLAADYTGDYFGFASTYRARDYDGTPNPTGADRDNPLIMDYQSFTVEETVIPEPATAGLIAAMAGAFLFIRRRPGQG
jgi:hypothetical protein